MRTNFLKSLAILFVSMVCCVEMTSAQVGPVVSVSQNQNSLPAPVNNFLSSYYPASSPTNVQLLTLQNAYQVTLNTGPVLTFDQATGRWLQIQAVSNYSVSQIIVFNLLPGSVYENISRNNLAYSISQLSFNPQQGYTIQTVDNVTYNFDLNGLPLNNPMQP